MSFDDWSTERSIVTDKNYHVHNASAQSVNSPKYPICSHQTDNMLNAPN